MLIEKIGDILQEIWRTIIRGSVVRFFLCRFRFLLLQCNGPLLSEIGEFLNILYEPRRQGENGMGIEKGHAATPLQFRCQQIQLLFSPGGSDIKQTTLLLNIFLPLQRLRRR